MTPQGIAWQRVSVVVVDRSGLRKKAEGWQPMIRALAAEIAEVVTVDFMTVQAQRQH